MTRHLCVNNLHKSVCESNQRPSDLKCYILHIMPTSIKIWIQQLPKVSFQRLYKFRKRTDATKAKTAVGKWLNCVMYLQLQLCEFQI